MNPLLNPVMHVERVPRAYSPALLLRVWRWLREDPAFRAVRVDDYFASSEPMTFERYRAWFRGCLDRKINRDLPKRGRKDCTEWFWRARHTARWVNTPRLIVHPGMVAYEFRERLAHRITWPEDEQ